MNSLSKAITMLFLTATVSVPLVAVAESGTPPIEKLIAEMANTPGQHQVLSQYYKDKAAAAKNDLAVHKSMRQAYMGHAKSPVNAQSMRMHCEKLVSLSEAEIKEYEDLAALHDAEYKKGLSSSDGK